MDSRLPNLAPNHSNNSKNEEEMKPIVLQVPLNKFFFKRQLSNRKKTMDDKSGTTKKRMSLFNPPRKYTLQHSDRKLKKRKSVLSKNLGRGNRN